MRSRLIYAYEVKDYKEFTITRSDVKEKNKKNKSRRDEIPVKNFEKTKLLNFYNQGVICFHNIAANDAFISSKINMIKQPIRLY